MAAPRPWTVLPHDPIQKLEDNLWTVAGRLPRGPMNRRMSVVRLGDGGLLFHNAIPLEERAMAEIEAFGRPAILVVPNGYHRLDLHAFRARYPALRVLCPAPARARVGAVTAVDGGWEALPQGAGVEAVPLDGSRWGEAALVVESAGGARTSLLFGDTVMAIPHQPGIGGLVLRLVGSSGGARVTRIARLFTVSDARALAAALERLAARPGLARLVPSHGDLVERDAAGVLRAVAGRLAAR
jgi:hypothetical protein